MLTVNYAARITPLLPSAKLPCERTTQKEPLLLMIFAQPKKGGEKREDEKNL